MPGKRLSDLQEQLVLRNLRQYDDGVSLGQLLQTPRSGFTDSELRDLVDAMIEDGKLVADLGVVQNQVKIVISLPKSETETPPEP